MHRRPPRWTTCRSKADGKHTRRLGSPAAFFISKSPPCNRPFPTRPPPPATEIRPLREAEIPAASALVRRVFAEFEAPDYAQEGIDVFHRFIAPEALTEQFRTGALKLWGAFRQDTLAGVAAVRNRSHISLLFVDASCHRQGIARALFSAVRDFCRTDPAVSRITVNSSPYAVEIYRRLGFTATDAERVTDGIRFTPMTYLL